MVKITDRPTMTIAVDMGRKATKTNKQKSRCRPLLGMSSSGAPVIESKANRWPLPVL